ncbi:MAG: transcription antitermination factor NusB, partial [Pyrinomonadaceae bacterium]
MSVIDLSERRAANKKGQTVSPARLAGFEILSKVKEGAHASVLLAEMPEEGRQDDRALTHELVLGVLRWQRWLDCIIEYFAGRAVANLDLAVRIALELGLYQVRFLSRVPASAAVNESVKLVRMARLRSAESFVNAVLRRATREPHYDPTVGIADPLERLAIESSHPTWLIERWANAFGLEETRAFALVNNQPAPVAFRIVPTMTNPAEVLDQLRASSASLVPSLIARGAWRITGAGGLLRDLSQAGKIYVQDEASQLVGEVLAAQTGDRVLDVCAAPGGKTSQIAASAQMEVIAGDLNERRLNTVRKTVRLHGLENVQSVVLDGRQAMPFSESSFDRVLVDAPCSGTGALRHNPEIRWRISAEDVRELAKRQKQILLNASRLVR